MTVLGFNFYLQGLFFIGTFSMVLMSDGEQELFTM